VRFDLPPGPEPVLEPWTTNANPEASLSAPPSATDDVALQEHAEFGCPAVVVQSSRKFSSRKKIKPPPLTNKAKNSCRLIFKTSTHIARKLMQLFYVCQDVFSKSM